VSTKSNQGFEKLWPTNPHVELHVNCYSHVQRYTKCYIIHNFSKTRVDFVDTLYNGALRILTQCSAPQEQFSVYTQLCGLMAPVAPCPVSWSASDTLQTVNVSPSPCYFHPPSPPAPSSLNRHIQSGVFTCNSHGAMRAHDTADSC
jgi:hypothetical protein